MCRYPAAFVDILVGTNDLKSGGTRYSSQFFISNEYYTRDGFANDIGLIFVKNIEFNDRVQPINCSTKYVDVGVELRFTGWGATYEGGSVSQQLQVMDMNSTNRI